jgi:hypothetical protein
MTMQKKNGKKFVQRLIDDPLDRELILIWLDLKPKKRRK